MTDFLRCLTSECFAVLLFPRTVISLLRFQFIVECCLPPREIWRCIFSLGPWVPWPRSSVPPPGVPPRGTPVYPPGYPHSRPAKCPHSRPPNSPPDRPSGVPLVYPLGVPQGVPWGAPRGVPWGYPGGFPRRGSQGGTQGASQVGGREDCVQGAQGPKQKKHRHILSCHW